MNIVIGYKGQDSNSRCYYKNLDLIRTIVFGHNSDDFKIVFFLFETQFE